MIRSFRESDTERLFNRQRPKRLPTSILRRVQRRLAVVDAGEALNEIRLPPGNRLEALKADRDGQHSIRWL